MPLSPQKVAALEARTVKPGQRKKLYQTVFGQPGAGKTVMAAGIGNKNLIISDETGYDSLVNHPELEARTTVMPFLGYQDVMDYCEGIDSGQFDYDHMILDTFSGMQDDRIMFNLDQKATSGFDRKHPDVPSWDDYNLSRRQSFEVLRRLMVCKAHVTVICHVRVPNASAMAKGETTRPDLTDKVFNIVNKYSSMLVYMEKAKDGVTRTVHFAGDNRISIKSRIIPEDVKKLPVDQYVSRIRNWMYEN